MTKRLLGVAYAKRLQNLPIVQTGAINSELVEISATESF